MIDERINNSLKELEQILKNIDSARMQVEKTVTAYDALTTSASEYIRAIGLTTTKVKELVNVISKDYEQKLESLEKDRDAIVKVANDAVKEMSDTADKFKSTFASLNTKLIISLVINIITVAAIVCLVFIK